MRIQIKRAYAPASEDDGRRVLVDRLWPRGISRSRAQLDEWLRAVAPSRELRMWFGHRAEHFEEFARLYRAELEAAPEQRAAVRHLLDIAAQGPLTLVYGAKDEQVNHAAVLRQHLLAQESGQGKD